ncbi:tetratricopeptide repeat protein [Kordiimonas aestuarii]|uniref:tetratricopeptide repeat protein n=1 Tax=Kordiimonas aestuarii TaxID=1005925 RepID=UPI0021D19DC5|nr:tetratricopeptide repeat protein [Kordiimonas aestuarii]
MKTEPTGVWCFGHTELNERTGTVTVSGKQQDIDRASVLILQLLVRHAGETVSKDVLLADVWPGRVVSENTLAKAVSRLRQNIGDDRDAIRVVHGFGYRLQADVTFLPLDELDTPPPAQTDLRAGLLRWPVYAVAVLLIVAMAALWQTHVSRQRAHLAEAEAAAALSLIVDDVLARIDPYQAGPAQFDERKLVEQMAQSAEARFGETPVAAARLHKAIALAYSGWGEYSRAAEHLWRARDLRLQVGTPPLPEIASLDLHLCQQLRLAGDIRAALNACSASLHSATDAGMPLSPARVTYAKALFEDGQYEKAAEILRPVAQAPAKENSAKTRGDALWFLALSQRKLAAFADARTAFLSLIDLQMETYGDRHPLTAWAYADYGDFLVETGDFAEAEQALAKAQSIFNTSLGANHPEALSPGYSLALMHEWRGEWTEARALLLPRLAGWRATVGSDHMWTLYTLTELALTEAKCGNLSGARQYLAEARKTSERLLYGRAAKSIYFHLRWARTELALGNWSQASTDIEDANIKIAAALPAMHPWAGRAKCLRARVAAHMGDIVTGHHNAQECLDTLAQTLPADHPAMREAQDLFAGLPPAGAAVD